LLLDDDLVLLYDELRELAMVFARVSAASMAEVLRQTLV